MGLQEPTADEVTELSRLGLSYTVQKSGLLSEKAVRDWIDSRGITKLLVHWDLDVISPEDFHSLYFTEPGVPLFSASSCGHIPFAEVAEALVRLQNMADIVGLTIAEYLPWDAFRLSDAMKKLKIFSE